MTAAQKRVYVSDLYPGHNWKRKVDRMPDDQITAIYLKHQADGKQPEEAAEASGTSDEQDETPDTSPPTVISGQPHANEDDFQIY